MRTSASDLDADVLFVDVPHEFRTPRSSWCLGYRYLIAALRRHGIGAAILHPRNGRDGLARAGLIRDLVEANAAVVGFTTYDVHLAPLLSLVKDLRKAGLRSHIVLGGLCASAVPERILSQTEAVDAVLIGEGEAAIVEHVQNVLHGHVSSPVPGVCVRRDGVVVRGPPRAPTADLETLAPPALDEFRYDDGASAPMSVVNGCLPVVASRGCYGRCTFCSIEGFYRRSGGKPWRGRSARSVVDDIAGLITAKGVRRITFVDENFMGPGEAGRRHALEIATEIQRRELDIEFNFGCRPNDLDRPTLQALQKGGLVALSIGAESAAETTLDLFNKGSTPQDNRAAVELARDLSLPLEITFIFFQPRSTLAEVQSNLEFVDFVRRAGGAYFNNGKPFTEFVPFFGTKLTASLVRQGLVERNLDGYTMRYADPRVDFIARTVLDVPTDRLVLLADALGALNRDVTTELSQSLLQYTEQLNMQQLPQIAADLCALFSTGAAIDDARVQRAATQARDETHRIHATASRVLAHLH